MSDQISPPIILHGGRTTVKDLKRLARRRRVWRTVDVYESQLGELFEILHPDERLSPTFANGRAAFIEERRRPDPRMRGDWIYYPWNGRLVHTVEEQDYRLIRTNRNRYIVTAEEQGKLARACVALAGLSIGAHFAIGLAYSGIGQTLKLADFDTLATSNLNRVRAGLADIGSPKIEIVAQQVYDVDPYADLLLFPEGLSEANLQSFLHDGGRPDVIFEAIDDFVMKINLRLAARQARIPVVMLTNLGDSLLVDIERYDLDPHLPLFNGLIGDTPEEIVSAPLTEAAKVKYAITIVGAEHIPTRVLDSLDALNRALVGRPQVFSTVTIGGGVAAYLARRLVLGQPLKSGRMLLRLGQSLGLDDPEDGLHRDERLRSLKERLGI